MIHETDHASMYATHGDSVRDPPLDLDPPHRQQRQRQQHNINKNHTCYNNNPACTNSPLQSSRPRASLVRSRVTRALTIWAHGVRYVLSLQTTTTRTTNVNNTTQFVVTLQIAGHMYGTGCSIALIKRDRTRELLSRIKAANAIKAYAC